MGLLDVMVLLASVIASPKEDEFCTSVALFFSLVVPCYSFCVLTIYVVDTGINT